MVVTKVGVRGGREAPHRRACAPHEQPSKRCGDAGAALPWGVRAPADARDHLLQLTHMGGMDASGAPGGGLYAKGPRTLAVARQLASFPSRPAGGFRHTGVGWGGGAFFRAVNHWFLQK